MEWCNPSSSQKKKEKVCKVRITVFWDCKGGGLVDAMPTGNYLQCLNQDPDRTQEVFQISSDSQQTNRNLASAWLCKAPHKYKVLESHKKNFVGQWHHIYTTATYLEPCRMDPWYEVRDWWQCKLCSEILTTWAGQGNALTWHTHLFLIRERPYEVDRDFVEKWGIDSNHHSS